MKDGYVGILRENGPSKMDSAEQLRITILSKIGQLKDLMSIS